MEKKMGNPERKSVEPGIGDIPEERIFGISAIDKDLLEVDWVPVKGRGISRRFFVGLGATGGLLALTGCVPSPIPPTETPIVTETTGIPPTPTLKIETPTPTLKIETPTPTATSTPEPTKTLTPEPIPTVTVEAVGFGMEDLTPEEQALAAQLETLYRTATENQGLKEGIIYLTHGDQVGEIGGYFKDKKGFWYLVEREGKEILEEVPKFQRASISWDPNEVRFEYKHQDLSYNWIWQPQGRLIYDPVVNDYVAQWNPETSSWKMNPEPPPEAATYIEGIPFVGFSEQDLTYIKDALTWLKEVDPEDFNFLVETNPVRVVYTPERKGTSPIPPYEIMLASSSSHWEGTTPDANKAAFLNTLIHENQHVRDHRRLNINAPRGICTPEYPRELWLELEVIACQRSVDVLSRLISHVSPEGRPYLERLKEGYQLIVDEPERLECPT